VPLAFATIAGTYQSIAAARADQAAIHSKCRAVRLLVLKTDDLRKLAPGKVALAMVTASAPAPTFGCHRRGQGRGSRAASGLDCPPLAGLKRRASAAQLRFECFIPSRRPTSTAGSCPGPRALTRDPTRCS
jgi:hypothetical protein